MKKIVFLIGVFCTTCLMAGPVFAINHVENTSCEGPSKIFFSRKTFAREYASSDKAYENPCRARYSTYPSSSDGHADDWAPYSVFYSQLIKNPKELVRETLIDIVPEGAILDNMDRSNPNDLVVAYRVIKKERERDLLRYILYRAVKQSDGTVRIYQLEIRMQADTHYLHTDRKGNCEWRAYAPVIAQDAYDHFNKVIVKNRAYWLKDMQALDTAE